MWLDAELSIRFVESVCCGAAPVREQQESLLTMSSREPNFENR